MRRRTSADRRRDRLVRSSNRPRRFLPGIQALERRQLLAGDPVVVDSSFEAVPTSTFVYRPTAPPWDFGVNTGLSANGSGFTGGNSGAPLGKQVAFVQKMGAFTQSIAGWDAGSYAISFKAAQRQNFAGIQTIQVKVDGVAVGTFTPSGTTYQTYTTNAFSVAAGDHTISFVGLSTDDYTVFLDDVAVRAAVPVVGDSGFETPVTSTYVANPAGSPWTFYSSSGLSANNSDVTSGNPGAPQGDQLAYLQNSGTVAQSIAGWQAGSYAISFKAAQRQNYPGNSQTIQVKVDGDVVGTFTPSGTAYQTYTTNAFSVVAGYHTVFFFGLASSGDIALLDDVRILPVLGADYLAPPGAAKSIALSSTIRDFQASHPDFQVDTNNATVKGLVAATLGSNGTPVFVGPGGAGGVTSAATFDQWYRPAAGVNQATYLPLILTETSPGSGVYEYTNTRFFPIDGRLFGNEGDVYRDPFGTPHNFHFTTQVAARFTYRGGETFNFWSDDDLWVFIDGRLVVDLGGGIQRPARASRWTAWGWSRAAAIRSTSSTPSGATPAPHSACRSGPSLRRSGRRRWARSPASRTSTSAATRSRGRTIRGSRASR